MIDLQNEAIVDILKESDNLARAEQVIQEAHNIKEKLLDISRTWAWRQPQIFYIQKITLIPGLDIKQNHMSRPINSSTVK